MGEAFQPHLTESLPKYKIILFSRTPQTRVSFLLQNSSMRCMSHLKINLSYKSIKQSPGKTSFGLKAQFFLTSVVVVNTPCFLQIGWSSSKLAPWRKWAATGKSLAWLANITQGCRDSYHFSWAPWSCCNPPCLIPPPPLNFSVQFCFIFPNFSVFWFILQQDPSCPIIRWKVFADVTRGVWLETYYCDIASLV